MATEEASANALEEERSSAASTTSKQEPDGPSSCPTVVPNLMLGDVQHGAFFNRTRMMIKKNQTMIATRTAASGTDPSSIRNLRPSQSLQQRSSSDQDRPSGGKAKPPASLDDYLQSLLPNKGFGASSGKPMAQPAVAVIPEAPASARGPSPFSEREAAADKPQEAVQATELTPLPDLPELERCPSPKFDAAASCLDEDASTHGGARSKLMATYHYEQVTADGGVALAFDNLESSTDSSTLQELHEAIESLVRAQTAASPVLLGQEVERELEALSALNTSLRERASTTDEIQPCADPSTAPGSIAVSPAKRLETVLEGDDEAVGVSMKRKAETEAVTAPVVSSPTQPQRDSGKPPLPPATVSPARDISASVGRTSRGSPAEKTSVGQRLLNKLLSVKEDLTATIQLGFQTGKFKRLNIAILVVGTRGDVQPFIGIALKLKSYGHRVRIASHALYREFVTGFGLEFYPLGGDPKVLSEIVVKHRGIMPGWNISDALQQRNQVKEVLYSSWDACTAPDPQRPDKPFRADAILANPPAYGHTHCAEALNVPLHILFTMPWTPTKAFPQPFARIKTNLKAGQNSKAREVMNWMSYFAVEDLAWLGMAGMQKDFRQRICGLKTWNKYTSSHAIYHLQVPVTYIWSPSLVPRPLDWPLHCEVVGFATVELKKLTAYEPPADLKAFLEAGPAPIYIGFGSLVVDNAKLLTEQFLTALQRTGLRAIIQRGWGGLGAEYGKQPDGSPGKKGPDNVLFIDAAPHDWLFQQVSAVIHHGGAGTTAAGLLAGKPTFIVPFFGDQPFWGAACEQAGVGPAPVSIDDLTTEKIIDALKELILPSRVEAAKRLCASMQAEDGVSAAVDHIHRSIYTALLGRSTPMWMQSDKQQRQQATSTVQEVQGEDGGGLIRGVMQIPMKILRSIGASIQLSSDPTAAASRASAAAGAASGPRASQPPRPAGALSAPSASSPTVVGDMPKRKGGIFSFLGC